jgi:hypothetical protein
VYGRVQAALSAQGRTSSRLPSAGFIVWSQAIGPLQTFGAQSDESHSPP